MNTHAPHTIDRLPKDEQERLAAILDQYLACLERGEHVSPEDLVRRHPDHGSLLKRYLSGLNLFHNGAASDGWAETLPMVGGTAPADPGRTIGDFRIDREIARGGMGVVYEAEQISLQRRVALKVLPFSTANDAKHITRFKNEAQAAAQIRHPNIVPVYAVGEHNGIHYYAMQLIAGNSLTTILEHFRSGAISQGTLLQVSRNGSTKVDRSRRDPRAARIEASAPLSSGKTVDHVRVVARLGIQAAAALHAAHELGIVHRDVKPSNLIVDDDGKLWITDFGLARCRERSGLTETGDILGTMRYMSPEQALGRSGVVDHRTDVYSLGVTLYELATLHHPAGEKSDLEILTDRNRAVQKRLRAWNRHIPVDFETIVLKAISESPADRYATAQDLADDLQRFVENKPILASPPSLVSRAGKWARRHRTFVYAGAAALLLALTGQAYYNWLLARSNAAKDKALVTQHELLQEAHAVLYRFSELGEQLNEFPGTEGVQLQLLEDSLAHYQRVRQKAQDEPALALDHALATSKLGTLSEKVGKKDEALKHHQAARALWLALQADEPDNPEHARNLVLTDNSIAMLMADLGQSDRGIEILLSIERSLGALRSADSQEPMLALDLATTSNNLGLLLRQADRPEEAIERFRTAIDLYQKLNTKIPDDASVLRGLAASYNNLGSLLKNSRRDDIVEVYERAISIQQRLVKAKPLHRGLQAELARTCNNLGYALANVQDWQRAEACYQDAVKIQEHLVKASPLYGSYRRDLAVSYNNLGMMQTRGGNFADAKRSFDRAIGLQRILLAAQPSDSHTLSNLGGIYNNLGLLYDQQQRFGEAEEKFKQAISLQQQACQAAPSTTTYSKLLSNHYVNYANSLRRQDKLAEAEAALHRSVALSSDPVNSRDKKP